MESHAFQSNSQSPYASMAMMNQKGVMRTGTASPSPAVPGNHIHAAQVDRGSRILPGKDVTAETIEDDYVQFVLYCNPSLSPSIETSELRRVFQSMPKTDGKSFSAFALFELIRRLENKEIETWAQLVIELGVAPPDMDKGQSTQKVQQYAVRLKRWLHASHIDAFFQYCLDKPNSYYTANPTALDGTNTAPRDGVPPEEDLALRALVPELRPKRGRRPNDESGSSPAPKRQLRAASLTTEDRFPSTMSAHPQSASPWDRSSNQRDLWEAAHRAIAPHPNQTPMSAQPSEDQRNAFDSGQLNFYMDLDDGSAHPQSAINTRAPMSAFPTSTPQSAHPFSSRPRKRHGPSVSAAWASDGTTGGKLRGRPPANRTTQDGPFSTFPAKQSPAQAPTSVPATATPGSAHPRSSGSPFGRSSPPAMRKPSKLQLQVPQHSGGPVRLATPPPPPKVVLNGSEGSNREPYERRISADFFNVGDEPSEMGESEDDNFREDERVDWKRKAMSLQRKVRELEAELKNMKRKVLEAVM